MSALWRIAIGAVAVFNILLGLAFLIAPAEVALRFFLAPLGTQGMATLRADFASFFLVGGSAALLGAVRRARSPLLVPIALIGVALTGRVVSLVADGVGPAALAPMLVEAAMIALLVLGYRSARS